MALEPFQVAVADQTLEDLRVRLAAARFDPEGSNAPDWSAGINPRYLRELVEYWRTGYDWREREAAINRLPQFRATLGNTRVHFIHVRGRGDRRLPLLLTHGFPDSFLRFAKLIPLLADPEAHGGNAEDAFDVVVPSLPGYAFSDRPPEHGGIFHVGDLWHRLMTDELGYQAYGAHGGDWGSTVTEHLARRHANAVVGIHLTDVPFWHGFQPPHDPTPAEARYLADNQQYVLHEGAYAAIQGTRPQTLADGLNDSPIGLCAWLVEKFQGWSDCNGDVERRFTKDDLLDTVMLYWATETIDSSFLPYFDFTQASALRWMVEKVKEWTGSSKVPAGFALFPKDLAQAPEEWARRFFNVRRWTQMPRGGHFAAWEEPGLVADEIRTFFRPLRPSATIRAS